MASKKTTYGAVPPMPEDQRVSMEGIPGDTGSRGEPGGKTSGKKIGTNKGWTQFGRPSRGSNTPPSSTK